MIIVTAGHVDHGKTTLLQALTGTDADRLPEEKRRGMTIDLGYAFMDTECGERLAFIDVPGHEKFINNMLAGVSSAKHALLVVAADDGVMPQTLEHMAILKLLNLETLTVAITKCDKADAAQLTRTENQLAQLLAGQEIQWECFAVSAPTGDGIPALKAHLNALVASHNPDTTGQSFRMTLDRAFSVKGAGVVVTGTVISGEVKPGDKLYCSGQKQALRVRGIHAQGQEAGTGKGGQRVALNLAGIDNHHGLSRGDWLSSLPQPDAQSRVTVLYRGDAIPAHWQSAHFHHGACHCIGKIGYLAEKPEANGHLLELVLDAPFLVARGDIIVLRDACGKQTLGGATVLETAPPSRGKRKPERLAYLSALAEQCSPDRSLAFQSRNRVVERDAFKWDWQLTDMAIEALLAEMSVSDDALVEHGPHIIAGSQITELKARLNETLDQYHQSHTDELGLGRARLSRILRSVLPQAIVDLALDEMLASGELAQSRGLIHLPVHQIALTDEEADIWQQMAALYTQNTMPLWVTDFSKQLGVEPDVIRPLCHKLVQLGYITAVVKDRYVFTEHLFSIAETIRGYLAENEMLETAEARQLINLGRKVSIQILELFDRTGFTRRVFKSSSRVIRDGGMYVL